MEASFFLSLIFLIFPFLGTSVRPQLAAQSGGAADKGWRFVLDTVLPGYWRAPQWVPARTPTVHCGPDSGKAVGGPTISAAQHTVQVHRARARALMTSAECCEKTIHEDDDQCRNVDYCRMHTCELRGTCVHGARYRGRVCCSVVCSSNEDEMRLRIRRELFTRKVRV